MVKFSYLIRIYIILPPIENIKHLFWLKNYTKIYINFHSSIDNQMFVYKLQFIIQ